MTKTYKHKTLGWEAIKQKDGFYLIRRPAGLVSNPPELIENSSDREEVVEKKTEQRILDVIEEYNRNYTHLNDHKLIQAIEKHAPKQKKFSVNDLVKWRHQYTGIGSIDFLHCFLSDHNLLSSDE